MTSNNDYDYGYIYCISNVSMPNILNIGITWMTPEQKIIDINGLPILWRPPTPYKCEFAKRVLNAEHKKNTIYKVLAQSRITPKQMFFNVPIEEVRILFDLMDGDYWEDSPASAASAASATNTNDIPANDIPANDIPANDIQIDNILEKKKVEIKVMEEKMIECLFQKCDELEMDIENRKVELSELNAVIEERKAALRDLDLQDILDIPNIPDTQIITEY